MVKKGLQSEIVSYTIQMISISLFNQTTFSIFIRVFLKLIIIDI